MTQAQLWEAGRVVIKGRRGRKVTACHCGECEKCKHRDYMRNYYYGIRRGKHDYAEHRSGPNKDGYMKICMSRDDPLFAMATGQTRSVLEHRLVMARHLDRPLTDEEHVHHRNGHKTDNRLENLELWTGNHPKGQRVEDLYAWAVAFVEQYQPEFG